MAGDEGESAGSVESRPGVLVIGAPNVGKRTLISRLLSIDFPDAYDLSSGVLCQGWNIQTKYYSADISIWTAHLEKGFCLGTLPFSKQLAALVMVFDINDESSFEALKDWVTGIDIEKFDILLCVGNKSDLVPGHYAHAEYRRRLQKRGESTSDPHPEYLDYGIHENEACSLLGDEEPSLELRKSYIEWCSEHRIEFIESCASSAVFDKCLSINGDIQGVERLHGALSAHIWPGMILKSGNTITTPYLVDKEETTDDESDYEVEYEVLSRGSDEPWDQVGGPGVSFDKPPGMSNDESAEVHISNNEGLKHEEVDDDADGDEGGFSTFKSSEDRLNDIPTNLALSTGTAVGDEDQIELQDGSVKEVSTSEASDKKHPTNVVNAVDVDEDAAIGFDDVERLMSEIGNMRDSLRLMPDFQRREMAAKMAMKMAAMFGDSSDEDGF